jgi:hypothetical protein
MKTLVAIAATGLVLLAGALPARAQTDDQYAMTDATCGDYIAALKRANPGKSPSKAAAAAAQKAQDALVDIALWAHGYQSGRAGPGTPLVPFGAAFIEAQVVKLARGCEARSPDGKLPLVDILRTL